MSTPSRTVEEWIANIQLELETMDNYLFYYPMKIYNLTHISTQSVELVKTCYLIEKKGLAITVPLLMAILKKPSGGVLAQMHSLGDKRVVRLLGTEGKKLVWVMHPEFKALLEPKEVRT